MKGLSKVSIFVTKITLKLIIIFIVFILALVFFNETFELNLLGYNLDKIGNEFLDEAIKKGGFTYLVVRISNAIISVIKESQVSVGIGIDFQLAIGQILDPIDDALERLSTLLVILISMLGTLKILFIILKDLYMKILSVLMFFLIPSLWFEKLKSLKIQIIKLILLITFLRFLIPISGLINTYIASTYIYPKIDNNIKSIEQILKVDKNFTEEMIGKLEKSKLDINESEENRNFFGKILGNIKGIKNKTLETFKTAKDYKNKVIDTLKSIWKNGDKLANAILNLMIYYLALLIIQVLLIPLGMLWLGIKVLNSLFDNISFADIKVFFKRGLRNFK